MKKLIVFALLLICFYSKAQTLNEQLYNAVTRKDTLQVEKLLNRGADVNYRVKTGEFEADLLILSVLNDDFKTVKLLVEHKKQVNWKDWFNTSALMYAASKGNLNIIKYLLENGADVHAKDEQGNTVLSAAKEGNHPEAVKLIEASLSKN